MHLSINKPSLKSIIIQQCVGVLSSSAQIRISSELVNLQILVMMMDKAQEKKLPRYKSKKILVLSADISKSEEISRWQPINKAYTAISLQLRHFPKIATNVYQKDSRSFHQWV